MPAWRLRGRGAGDDPDCKPACTELLALPLKGAASVIYRPLPPCLGGIGIENQVTSHGGLISKDFAMTETIDKNRPDRTSESEHKAAVQAVKTPAAVKAPARPDAAALYRIDVV